MFEGDDYYHKWGVLCWPTVQGFIHHTTDGSIFRPMLNVVENLKFKLEV